MATAQVPTADLARIKRDLCLSRHECAVRGLRQSAKWAAELAFALRHVQPADASSLHQQDYGDDAHQLSRSYFDLQEYDRAAHFTKGLDDPKTRFLHFYSRYLSDEKKRLDDIVEPITAATERGASQALKDLHVELRAAHDTLDGYCLYLYGVVLKRLQLRRQAMDVLVEAVRAEPLHWGGWLELASLVSDRDSLQGLELPDHWMKKFFLGHTYVELQLNDEVLETYEELQRDGFADSTYLMAQVAIAHHNMRVVDRAIEGFQRLQRVDPYRLDNMDIYSNLLYVKEQRVELSHLAHHTCSVDKYRAETCCVIGNFYSLRSQHEKAVLYFQRALRLNPTYFAAWTLMGHEYMEMKNTSAAVQAYRQAVEVNWRDYRAWYGLGQTYEMLKMPNYCLYYYRRAQQLRPSDSRMMVALGEAYEKLDKLAEAQKCFWRAHAVGDVEGMALFKLARVYERLGHELQARAAFADYVRDCEARAIPGAPGADHEEQAHACVFLAKHYLREGALDKAYEYAHKCTEFAETKEDAKGLLKQVSDARAAAENGGEEEDGGGGMQVEGDSALGAGDGAGLLGVDGVPFRTPNK
ncbi:unnamed protein product [Ixodes pacificus]